MALERHPKDIPDAQIVDRVLAGDREVYAELVRRHQESLFRHALGMVGNSDAAADLTQESLIRAFTRLHSCNDPARFGAWAFRILHNSCLDYLKDRRRQSVGVDDETVFGVTDSDPETSLEQEELRDAVFRALEHLPDSQKEAFLLKHVEELSYEEMTERLGVSISALKMRVKRARETLQSHLAVRRGEEL